MFGNVQTGIEAAITLSIYDPGKKGYLAKTLGSIFTFQGLHDHACHSPQQSSSVAAVFFNRL